MLYVFQTHPVHHVAIATGFKQTERSIFLHVIAMTLKLQLFSI